MTLIPRHLDYITVTNWAFLNIYEPLFHAVNMKDMIAYRNFYKFFFVLEILETQGALSLVDHVGLTLIFQACILIVFDLIHYLKVHSNHRFSFLIHTLIAKSLKGTVAGQSATTSTSLLCIELSQIETNDLDYYNQKEDKD